MFAFCCHYFCLCTGDWPWGDQPPAEDLCNFAGNAGDTTPVDKYPKGAIMYGVYMAGDVWEWTSSRRRRQNFRGQLTVHALP